MTHGNYLGTIDRDSTIFLTSDREDVKTAVEAKLKQKGFKVIRYLVKANNNSISKISVL